LAWEGSFIRCFTGSEAEYTLKSELYTLAVCGENRITDMNNVQWALSLFGRFLYKFFKNFYSNPNISLLLFGRYNGKGKGVQQILHPPEHQPTAIWQIQRKGKRRMPLSRHNGGGGELV